MNITKYSYFVIRHKLLYIKAYITLAFNKVKLKVYSIILHFLLLQAYKVQNILLYFDTQWPKAYPQPGKVSFKTVVMTKRCVYVCSNDRHCPIEALHVVVI